MGIRFVKESMIASIVTNVVALFSLIWFMPELDPLSAKSLTKAILIVVISGTIVALPFSFERTHKNGGFSDEDN